MTIVLLVLLTAVCGCEKKGLPLGVDYRPEGFPAILVAPEDALDVMYAGPGFARIAEGSYSLRYHVSDAYPGEKTIAALREAFAANGCVKVEWTRQDYAWYTKDKESGTYVLDEEATQRLHEGPADDAEGETQWRRKNRPHDELVHEWGEEWITPDDDLVSLVLTYRATEMRKLYVDIALFTPSSWRYPYVKKYKGMHPERFEGMQEQEE